MAGRRSGTNPIKGNMQWEEGGGYIARYLYPSNECMPCGEGNPNNSHSMHIFYTQTKFNMSEYIMGMEMKDRGLRCWHVYIEVSP